MSANRREFVFALGAVLGAGFIPRLGRCALAEPERHFAAKPLRDGAYCIGELTSGGNVVAMPTSSGPILIDAKHAHTAMLLNSDVQSLFKSRPALLINTHHHADHSGGNWMFADTARVVAHKNFNPRIESNLSQYVRGAENEVADLRRKGADAVQIERAQAVVEKIKSLSAHHFKATTEIGDATTVITHGGVTLNIYHFGIGHTDNDLVIHFPKQNILHTGDLLFHNLHPYIDRSAKANTRHWQLVLRQVMAIANDDTIVVPGHGEVTTRDALTRQIEYFDQLRGEILKAIKEGKSRDEIIAMSPDVFRNRGFEQIRPVAFGGMYDELMAEQEG